jgi:lipid-A-disaccharide synthase
MAVIFPFEKKFYEKHAVPVTYVGHPLTEKIKTTLTQTAAREKLKLSEYNPLITLCPGSRYSELESLLPTMLLAARKVAQQFPNALFLIAQASTITKERILQLLEDNLTTKNSTAQVHFKIVSDDSLNAMSASDLIVTASGTATLEAALLNKPMIVVYKVSLVTGFIIKRMLKIQHISLCNIVAGEKVVPELIQENFTESQLVEEMLKILTDTGLAQNTITKLKIINQQLGDLQAADSVAAIAERMLQ